MSDQPLKRPLESGDQRAARWLNAAMAMLIVICAAVFGVWMLVVTLSPVVGIYRALSGEQHRQLLMFFSALWLVILGSVQAIRAFRAFLARWHVDR